MLIKLYIQLLLGNWSNWKYDLKQMRWTRKNSYVARLIPFNNSQSFRNISNLAVLIDLEQDINKEIQFNLGRCFDL